MVKMRFKDKADQYFPKTAHQFQTAVDGLTHSTVAPNKYRSHCVKQFCKNLALIPTFPIGASYNFIRALLKAGGLIKTTFVLPWSYSANKNIWQRKALRLIDYTGATFLNPAKHILTAGRFGVGIFKPSLVFRNDDQLLIRRQLNAIHKEQRKQLSKLIEDHAGGLLSESLLDGSELYNYQKQELAEHLLFSAFFNYANRWQLTKTGEPKSLQEELINFDQHSKGYWQKKKELEKVKRDGTWEKYCFQQDFGTMITRLTANKGALEGDFANFIKNSIKTPMQQAVFENFSQQINSEKGISQYIKHSSFNYLRESCLKKLGAEEEKMLGKREFHDHLIDQLSDSVKEILESIEGKK